MQYRGIQYTIKMGAGRNVWVWTVHTPKPKSGTTTGTRAGAIRDAEREIRHWCYQYPVECEPAQARQPLTL